MSRRQKILRVVLLIVLLAGTVLIVIYRDQLQNLAVFGYPGVFLVSFLSNATIIIPIPGIVFTTAIGAVYNPNWVAIVAGLGAGLGELSGYLGGIGGQVILENTRVYHRIKQWVEIHDGWAILLLAFIPNPFFDVAGFIAGAGRMPVWKFLLFCIAGKIAKMFVFAYLGAGLFSFFD